MCNVGDVKAASDLRQEIIKNMGSSSIYATQDAAPPLAESGEEDGGVKTFVTDIPLVTKAKGPASQAHSPVNEDPNSSVAVETIVDPTAKSEQLKKRSGVAVLPNSVTYATRPKKKNPAAAALK